MVICDKWSLMLLLQKDYDSLKAQMMVRVFLQLSLFNEGMDIVFRHNAFAHLIDYSVVET